MADTLICPECESDYADFRIEVEATITVYAPVHVSVYGMTRWGEKPYAGYDSDFVESVDKIANKVTWREARDGVHTLELDVSDAGEKYYDDENVLSVTCDNCGHVFNADEGYDFRVSL